MSDRPLPDSHHDILAESWARLVRGADSADDPFRTAVLATGAAAGASQRTVVVRRVEPASRAICCHTDLRSAKIAELRQVPAASWLLYDPAERIQLRLRGPAAIHAGDGLADELWAATSPWTRRGYCGPAPGQPLAGVAPGLGLPPAPPGWEPSEAETSAGRANFAVIRCLVVEIDWLSLRRDGNLRAGWRWDGAAWRGGWIAP